MKVIKIEPSGYCKGVKDAISKLKIILNDDTYEKPAYVIGDIVHNAFVRDEFKTLGVINLKRDEREIRKIKNGTFVIPAHGLDKSLIDAIHQTGLKYVDTTCPFVKKVHNNVIRKINEGYRIIYIGYEGHPETCGVLSLNKNILLSTKDHIPDTDDKKIYVTNQTTFSMLDIKDILLKLKDKYPVLEFENDICFESTKRQMKVLHMKDTDLCIVIGDVLSSNTKRLYEISALNTETIMIQSVKDLKNHKFDNIKTISVVSGASTPPEIIDEVVYYLKNI